MPIAKIVPGNAYPVAESFDKFCKFLSPDSFATAAQVVPTIMTKKEPTKDTKRVFLSTNRFSKILLTVVELITFVSKIAIGIKKPKHTGTTQISGYNIQRKPFILITFEERCFLLVSLNLLPDRDIISRTNNKITKIKYDVS